MTRLSAEDKITYRGQPYLQRTRLHTKDRSTTKDKITQEDSLIYKGQYNLKKKRLLKMDR